jgi:hypothetical protein
MATRDGAQELVVLLDATGTKIEQEMRFGQFNGLLAQKATLDSHADRMVKAAYAQVGAGLTVQAVVLFLFRVNEQGYVDPAFNLPLDYMAEHAGEGPDLGSGIINLACRSQCPVPWHGINLWEPATGAETHPAMLVQKAVWRNRLGLKPVPVVHKAGSAVASFARQTRMHKSRRQALEPTFRLDEVANGEAGMTQMRSLEDKLTATFGDAGRVGMTQQSVQHHSLHD